MSDLTKGIAVITGAGGGLGRALAVELSQHMTVVGLGRDMATLENTKRKASKGRFQGIATDVADFNSVLHAFDNARDIGDITLLINNAAAYPRRDFTEETAESFMQVVATNLGGTVACTRAVLDDMVHTGFGRILNVATFADIAPLPASSAYTVSKGAARILNISSMAGKTKGNKATTGKGNKKKPLQKRTSKSNVLRKQQSLDAAGSPPKHNKAPPPPPPPEEEEPEPEEVEEPVAVPEITVTEPEAKKEEEQRLPTLIPEEEEVDEEREAEEKEVQRIKFQISRNLKQGNQKANPEQKAKANSVVKILQTKVQPNLAICHGFFLVRTVNNEAI